MKNVSSRQLTAVILILGILGQIAWGLENSWFNTYTYDVITKETWPIALMNGTSAVVATLTTFWMGTVSDRAGTRKPFIRYGYVIWGITTAGFILSEYFPTVRSRCIMVVVLDCVMTFFGSTAYDACFNAWTTDISDEKNRGKTAVLIQLAPIGAQVILAGAGIVVDRFGYHFFFMITGLIVSICGFITGGLIQDSPQLKPTAAKDNVLKEVVSCFSRRSFRENRDLFLVLTAACIFLCGFQVVYAYEMIYANNYLHIAKTYASLLSAAALPVMILGGIYAGKKVDEGKPFIPLWLAPGLFAAGAFVHASASNILFVILARALFYGGYIIMNITALALFKALAPEEARGRFEGVRMVFMVLLPMMIGPAVGSFLIGKCGLSPVIYVVCGIIALCSYIFIFLLKKKRT